MPTLNIGGRKVTVGDEFLNLSPEEQNATVEEIAASLPKPKGLPPKPFPGPSLIDMGQELLRLARQTKKSFGEAAEGIAQSREDAVDATALPAMLTTSPAAGTTRAIAQAAGLGKPMTRQMAQDARYLAEGLARPPTPQSVAEAGAKAVTRPFKPFTSVPPVKDILTGVEYKSVGQQVDNILSLASSREATAVKALFRERSQSNAAEWAGMQSEAIKKMFSGDTPIAATANYVQSYANLTPSGKRILFGSTKDGKALMRHLDTIHEAAREVAKGYEATQPTFAPSVGSNALAEIGGREAGRLVGRALGLGPLSILTAVLGERVASTLTSGPAAVASTAAWSSAYSQLIRNPSPKSFANFGIATRNLSNTLGEPIDQDKLLEAAGIKIGRLET